MKRPIKPYALYRPTKPSKFLPPQHMCIELEYGDTLDSVIHRCARLTPNIRAEEIRIEHTYDKYAEHPECYGVSFGWTDYTEKLDPNYEIHLERYKQSIINYNERYKIYKKELKQYEDDIIKYENAVVKANKKRMEKKALKILNNE